MMPAGIEEVALQPRTGSITTIKLQKGSERCKRACLLVWLSSKSDAQPRALWVSERNRRLMQSSQRTW